LQSYKDAKPVEFAAELHLPRKTFSSLESCDLKRRSILAPVCGEACWILRATRVQRASSLRAHFRVRHRAPNKYGRRAMRSPPLSDGTHLHSTFSPLARNSSPSWACSSPFDCGLHFTGGGKQSLENSSETSSKDSIHRIDETGSAGEREKKRRHYGRSACNKKSTNKVNENPKTVTEAVGLIAVGLCQEYATLPFFQSAVNPVGTEEGW
jgi:hypothetical protein